MLKSMTGFSKVETELREGRLNSEARALNNRYLEISLKLPKVDYSSEQKLRDLVKRYIKRGKVDISVKWEKAINGFNAPRVNENTVKQYLEVLTVLKKRFGLKGEPTVQDIMSFKDIIAYEENNSLSEDRLMSHFKTLLGELDKERTREGRLIHKDLTSRLKTITRQLKEIEERHPIVIKLQENKLKERMMEIAETACIDETRVLQEVAIYMERLDIAEEIVRLNGHMENFKDTLKSDDTIGRKLDFIIQEMVRETNTIGSKSSDLFINERVVQIKVEIEKMREQAQNVE